MESLYPQVVDVLISNGDINTLAALWKEISYVPSLHYLKNRINESVPEIADILSVQVPKLKIVNWRLDPYSICFINLKLNIYGLPDQLSNFGIQSHIDFFIKLVNYYDSVFLIDLIEKENCEDIINYLINNQRSANRFLKVLLILLNQGVILFRYKEEIGTILYWLLVNNQDLLRERRRTQFFQCILYNVWCEDKKIFISYCREAEKVKNYYPLFQLEYFNYIKLPSDAVIFLIEKSLNLESILKRLIESRSITCEVLEKYFEREDIIEDNKINLLEELLKLTARGNNYINYSLVNSRLFRNHFLFQASKLKYKQYYSKFISEIIEKHGIDEEYNPYNVRRNKYDRRLKTFNIELEKKRDADDLHVEYISQSSYTPSQPSYTPSQPFPCLPFEGSPIFEQPLPFYDYPNKQF